MKKHKPSIARQIAEGAILGTLAIVGMGSPTAGPPVNTPQPQTITAPAPVKTVSQNTPSPNQKVNTIKPMPGIAQKEPVRFSEGPASKGENSRFKQIQKCKAHCRSRKRKRKK